MKKLMSMILVLAVLMTGLALAEGWTPTEEAWTESVTYRGDGIFVIDFMKDIPWRTGYLMTLKDAADNPMTYIALGGDASEAVVQVQGEIEPDALYTFTLIGEDSVFYAVGQATKGFTYANHCEYCMEFGHDDRACAARQAAGVQEVDRCDRCGALDHEDDFCPTRQSGVYCDECGEYGHDDDVCIYDDDDDPYDRCDRCGAYGHDENRCTGMIQTTPTPVSGAALQPTPLPAAGSNAQTGGTVMASSTPQPKEVYCGECREYGHDDDYCPYERCDECGEKGHDEDVCPNEKCDRCGEYGHDDDRCPERTCKRCGEKGHSKDDCPTKKCDECGQTGHDDDRCPNERCDECRKTGHDDDDCPYDRDDD